MRNLCKLTVAMLGLAVAGGISIAPSNADTVIMDHADVMLVPSDTTVERVMVQPVVIPQVRTQSAVVTTETRAFHEPYSVQTRYGDVRLFERPSVIAPETRVEMIF